MDKNAELTFNVTTTSKQYTASNVRFSSQDEGSAKLTFFLYKDGVELPLSAVTGKIVMRMADGSKFLDTVTILDKVKGIVEYRLTKEQLKHYGMVISELYLNYENGQKMSIHRFSFTIEQALIDADIAITTEFYIDDFYSLKETINSISDETLATIQQVGEKVDNATEIAQTAIDLINQNQVAKQTELDKTNANVAAIPNVLTYLTDDSVGNGISINIPYSLDYLRKRQNVLLASAYKKINDKEQMDLCCLGDSTTYGHDTVSSDIRPAKSDPTLDQNQTYTYTQASISYPEALQEYITKMGLNIKVLNRGFSGDTAGTSYNRWKTPSGAKLSFAMFGLNDTVDTLENFRNNYIKLISREILRGTAVVILTPFKTKVPKINIESYTNVIYGIGQMFGIPVIEMDIMMDNYSASIHSDDFHLNGTGYRMIAARLTSLLIGNGAIRPNTVKSGDKVLTRILTDNCIYSNGVVYESNGGMDTPDEITAGSGMSLKLTALDQRVYYSFYTEEDDLLIFPDLFRSGTTTVDIELDFDTIKPKHSLNYATNGTNTSDSNGIVTKLSLANAYRKKDLTGLSDQRYIYVAKKGWHTLSIKKTVDTGTWWIRGLEFVSYEDYRKIFRKGYFSLPVNLGETSSVIDIYELCNALNIDPIDTDSSQGYWDSVACSVTVHSYNDSIAQYMFNLSNIRYATNWDLSSNVVIYNLTTTNGATRPLTSLTFDPTTKKLTLNWGGSVNKKARAVIKIA